MYLVNDVKVLNKVGKSGQRALGQGHWWYLTSRQSEELDLNPSEWELVVTLNKERFKVKTLWGEDGFTVDIEGKKEIVLNTDWLVGEPMMLADMNGKEVTVQVSGDGSVSCEICM